MVCIICSELLFVLQGELEAWPAGPLGPSPFSHFLPALFQGQLVSKVGVVSIMA